MEDAVQALVPVSGQPRSLVAAAGSSGQSTGTLHVSASPVVVADRVRGMESEPHVDVTPIQGAHVLSDASSSSNLQEAREAMLHHDDHGRDAQVRHQLLCSKIDSISLCTLLKLVVPKWHAVLCAVCCCVLLCGVVWCCIASQL